MEVSGEERGDFVRRILADNRRGDGVERDRADGGVCVLFRVRWRVFEFEIADTLKRELRTSEIASVSSQVKTN